MPGLVATSSSTVSAPAGPNPSACGVEADLQRRPLHRELAELGSDALFEAARCLLATLSELGGQLRPLALGRGEALGELALELGGVLEALDLRAASLRVLEHGLDRAAVLALEAVDRGEALLDHLQPPRLRLDALQVGAQLAAEVGQLHRHAADPLGERVESLGPRRQRRPAHASAAARRSAAPPSSSSPPAAARAAAAAPRSPSAWRRRSRSARSSCASAGSGAAASISASSNRSRSRSRSRAPSRSRSAASSRGEVARLGSGRRDRRRAARGGASPANPSSTSSWAEARVSLRCSCWP